MGQNCEWVITPVISGPTLQVPYLSHLQAGAYYSHLLYKWDEPPVVGYPILNKFLSWNVDSQALEFLLIRNQKQALVISLVQIWDYHIY